MKRLLTLILTTFAVLLPATAQADYPVMPKGAQGPFPVIKVVDGDTIWVSENGQRVKVRPIGLDTPETVDPPKPLQCCGLEASAQAKTILGGQSVYLETDPSQDSVDRFGRTLAYVWTESGRLFNLDMIANGYAFEYTCLESLQVVRGYRRAVGLGVHDRRLDARSRGAPAIEMTCVEDPLGSDAR